MTPSGAPLVNALLRAALHYAAQGRRVHLARQEHTPGRTTAHADLIGGVDGRSVALEAKMTAGDYFPLYPARAKQRQALQVLHEQGADVSLVVEFTDYGEVYVIAWGFVQEFLDNAWRRSLSLDWCRVYGRLARQLGGPKRAVFWRDVVDHELRYASVKNVFAESNGKRTFKIDGDHDHDEARDRRLSKPSAKTSAFRDLLARKPPRDAPETERLRWVNEMSAMELERNVAEARRKQSRTKRRGWAGGGG